jgi:hypothetical protein
LEHQGPVSLLWQKKLEEQGYTRINQDDQGKDHMHVFDLAVIHDENIVVDRMGFSKQQRSRYLEIAKANGYQTEIQILYVPYATCLERAIKRTDHPTVKDEATARKAVSFFFSKYEKVEDNEADTIIKLGQNGTIPAIICDLDGTLFDVEHRRHFVRGEGKKDWRRFFLEMVNDPVKSHVLDILEKFSDDYRTVFCSGRPKEYEKITRESLDRYISYDDWILLMREAGDHRSDAIVKEILLDFDILTQFKPFFILDDRDIVVKMWRDRGFECLQVAPGDF